MNGLTIYEFDALAAAGADFSGIDGVHMVPANVFSWLEGQCLRAADVGDAVWLRWAQRRGRRVIQVTSFVGVIRSPDGYQIEVLPKVGKAIGGGAVEARQLLIEMLCCLHGFRHVLTDSAKLSAVRMPLLEIFISEFLRTVEHIVKRGLRSDYRQRQDNLFALRGKLMMSPHLRQNLFRADRFFTEHDEFSMDRPENRLLHAALRRVLLLTGTQANQQLARELDFVFADIPPSTQTRIDFQQVRLDRGMGHYADALAWTRLILNEESPLTGSGRHSAPSLLFPMEAVFEAYVAKHLPRQLTPPLILKTQARSHHLVRHREQNWFRLKPDLLVRNLDRDLLVLDTKWKLLDGLKANGTDKYCLSQSDFYQLQAYGLSYLDGTGDVVLIYPRTGAFADPLPVFDFPKTSGIRLWVLPFCLKERRLKVPGSLGLRSIFVGGNCNEIQTEEFNAVPI
ncbi:MAG: McrC family protein [Ferrovum myxofaciens]|uniref:McrC family protein n=1 Tax=Ferrovum myxofaciens TaxID=416213 RepID=UPI0023526D1E|nr:McrC family protein [Ferrovum myxofaciens]QKE40311.1 MAG: McrC family protein [Ferrovum myxofaciens]